MTASKRFPNARISCANKMVEYALRHDQAASDHLSHALSWKVRRLMLRKRRARGLLFAILLCACRPAVKTIPATEILLRVTAEAEVRSAAKKLRVHTAVQLAKDKPWSDQPAVTLDVNADEQDKWPVDIPVVPRSTTDLPELIQVVAEALDDDGAVLVQQRVLTNFVREAQLVLEIRLSRCGQRELGEVCEADALCHGPQCQSCVAGACANTMVTPANALPSVGAPGQSASPDTSTAAAGNPAMHDTGAAKSSPSSQAGTDAGKAGTAGVPAAGKNSDSAGRGGDSSSSWYETRCSSDADCGGAECLRQGWCAVVCNDDSRCGKSDKGIQHVCHMDYANGDGSTCFVGCDLTSKTGCETFSGTTCQPIIGNNKQGVCDIPRGPGYPCSDDVNCESALVCISDTWCSPTSCTTDDECKTSPVGAQNRCLRDGSDQKNICYATCKSNDDCSSFNNSTCQIVSGQRVCRPPRVGSYCTDDQQCGKNWTCTRGHWCTPNTCMTDADCAPSSSPDAAPARCIINGNSAKTCFPGCVSTNDCSAYDQGITCQSSAQGSICQRRLVGTKCTSNEQCGAGWICAASQWCSPETCSSNDECGTSASGYPAVCSSNSAGKKFCWPGCLSDADCRAYPNAYCDAEKGCSKRPVGTTCTSNEQCGAGWICAASKWCSPETCSSNEDCGTSLSGYPAVCASNSAGKKFCWPGCLSDADCGAYPNTRCDAEKGCSGIPSTMGSSE